MPWILPFDMRQILTLGQRLSFSEEQELVSNDRNGMGHCWASLCWTCPHISCKTSYHAFFPWCPLQNSDFFASAPKLVVDLRPRYC